MTEELKQKAEEYGNGMAMYYESTHGGIPSQLEKYLRNAYIAGATENDIKIHKTSEFDFPEEGSEVLCFGRMLNGLTYKAILKYDGCFHDENGTPYEPEIKAWCEIPQFKE